MSVKKLLPEGAYAALEGLKAQADAAMLMLPGESKTEGEKALAAAHAQIAENAVWARRIVAAIMAGDEKTTVVSVDAEWLERTFADPSD